MNRLRAAIWIGLVATPLAQAQSAAPAYMKNFPSVDRVMSAMQANDADETAARRMGAFWQLRKAIEDMAGPRRMRPGLSPEETKLWGEYSAALAAIQKLKPEYAKFPAMHGYDVSPQFRAELFGTLFPPGFAAEYTRLTGQAVAQYQAVHEARVKNENQQFEEAKAKLQSTMDQNAAFARDLRRCLSAGGSELECMLRTEGKGLSDLFGSVVADVKELPPPRLVLAGEFRGQAGFVMTFGAEGTVAFTCGDLVADPRKYILERKVDGLIVHIDNAEQPLSFSLMPDLRLAGPPSADVHGRIIVGYTDAVITPMATPQNPYPIAQHVRVPVYRPKTIHAAIGALMMSAKTLPAPQHYSVASGMAKVFANAPQKPRTTPPGLRMTGQYAGPAGFDIDFYYDSAVIGCGDLETERPYSVQLPSGKVMLEVQDNSRTVTLELRPDSSLAGAGSITVEGRMISGRNANGDFVYKPGRSSCSVGVLNPSTVGKGLVPR